LSDLHFGADYGFLPQSQRPQIGERKKTLTEALRLDLTRLHLLDDIALVVVTGDFTTRGDWTPATKGNILAEFEQIRQLLRLERWQIVAIPGNHDIVRYKPDGMVDAAEIALGNQVTYEHEVPYREFLEDLTGRDKAAPLDFIERYSLPEVDIAICGLNSCRIVATQWTEYGYVGDKGTDVIKLLGDEPTTRPTVKMLAVHHHLLPVISVEAPNSAGVSLCLDACAVLDSAQSSGIHLALHGHQHLPRIVRYQPLSAKLTHAICVLSNGSAGVIADRRGDERNTYAILKPDKDSVRLWLRELRPDGRAGADLYKADLDLTAMAA
jgi:predicted phosphodiesterase